MGDLSIHVARKPGVQLTSGPLDFSSNNASGGLSLYLSAVTVSTWLSPQRKGRRPVGGGGHWQPQIHLANMITQPKETAFSNRKIKRKPMAVSGYLAWSTFSPCHRGQEKRVFWHCSGYRWSHPCPNHMRMGLPTEKEGFIGRVECPHGVN